MKFTICAILISMSSCLFAVNSEIVRHSSAQDFADSEPNNIVIDSQGAMRLARENEVLLEKIPDSWVINTAISSSSNIGEKSIYLGTSPNGAIYKYDGKKLAAIFLSEIPEPQEEVIDESDEQTQSAQDPNEAGEIIEQDSLIANEHIFALAFDSSNRLLAGVSGENCRLLRFGADNKAAVIFEPEDSFYIFAIHVNSDGRIFVATGPQGKIFALDSDASNPKVLVDLKERNILSLATDANNNLFAGVDENGIIYKINPKTKKYSAILDCEQNDITSIVFDEIGNLYAAATNSDFASDEFEQDCAAPVSPAGRNGNSAETKSFSQVQDVVKIQIANSARGKEDAGESESFSENASVIYKITPQGFVFDIYAQPTLFLSLFYKENTLTAATSANAQLVSIDTKTQKVTLASIIEKTAQATSIVGFGEDICIATANPARLLVVRNSLAKVGSIESPLIDAGQPALWGKIQIDASIPKDASILVSVRSGNSEKISDDLFSDWSKPKNITAPLAMDCPVARFAQYKLIFKGALSPIVREIAVSHLVENISPRIVSISAAQDSESPEFIAVDFYAEDDNQDNLTYKLEFRETLSGRWISLEEEIEESPFQWESRSVPDGIYELRITANDAKSNSPTTAKTASWISEPFIIDNTPPKIAASKTEVVNSSAKIELAISDEFSMMASLAFTVDSSKDWISTLPDDLVFDTKNEEFTILANDLESGDHLLCIKASDDAGNTIYKSFYVTIE